MIWEGARAGSEMSVRDQHVSHNLNSSKGGDIGDHVGDCYEGA